MNSPASLMISGPGLDPTPLSASLVQMIHTLDGLQITDDSTPSLVLHLGLCASQRLHESMRVPGHRRATRVVVVERNGVSCFAIDYTLAFGDCIVFCIRDVRANLAWSDYVQTPSEWTPLLVKAFSWMRQLFEIHFHEEFWYDAAVSLQAPHPSTWTPRHAWTLVETGERRVVSSVEEHEFLADWIANEVPDESEMRVETLEGVPLCMKFFAGSIRPEGSLHGQSGSPNVYCCPYTRTCTIECDTVEESEVLAQVQQVAQVMDVFLRSVYFAPPPQSQFRVYNRPLHAHIKSQILLAVQRHPGVTLDEELKNELKASPPRKRKHDALA